MSTGTSISWSYLWDNVFKMTLLNGYQSVILGWKYHLAYPHIYASKITKRQEEKDTRAILPETWDSNNYCTSPHEPVDGAFLMKEKLGGKKYQVIFFEQRTQFQDKILATS